MEIQHTKLYVCCVLSHVQLCDPNRLCNPTRLPCLWNSLGKNTGVGCYFLLQPKCMGCSKSSPKREVYGNNAYIKKQEIAQIDNLNLYFKKLQGLPWWLSGKESTYQKKKKNLPANVGDTGSIPGPGRSHMPWGN